MKIVTVVPLIKGVFKENLTYFSNKEAAVGGIVEVSIRQKKILALIIHTENLDASKSEVKKANFNLKKIDEVKEHSIFRSEYLDSAIETSMYFAQLPGKVLSTLIPVILREEYDKMANFVSSIPEDRKFRTTNIKSEKLLFLRFLSAVE